ncbi:MAG: hypothetical protein U0174_04230 [Polyangiaceae bacterium]
MQTTAARILPANLEYPPCLIEEKGPGLFLASKENRAKAILQIDEALLRSMPIDPFDAARTKKRKALSVECAVNALRKSASTAQDTPPSTRSPLAPAADGTLDIDPDDIAEVELVAANLTSASIASLAVPRKTSLNTPRMTDATPAPVQVAPVAAVSSVSHPAPQPVWSSEVRLRAAAPVQPVHAPVVSPMAQTMPSHYAPPAMNATRSSSMPPPVVMPSVHPQAQEVRAASGTRKSMSTGLVLGSAFAFLAVAAGVFAVSFQLGAGSSPKAAAAGTTRTERVTRVVDPGIRVAAPERVPTISVSMLPRAGR